MTEVQQRLLDALREFSLAVTEVDKLELAAVAPSDRRYIKVDKELDLAVTRLLLLMNVSPITKEVKEYVKGYEPEE